MVSSLKSHSISVRGAKQLDSDEPCQDSSAHYCADKYTVIAVSDGHGGDKYFRSAQGAKIAVDVALDCVKECFAEQVFIDVFITESAADTDREKRLSQLKESIVSRWNEAVHRALEENPIEEEELSGLKTDIQEELSDENSDSCVRAYGATLIVAVVGLGFWFGIHIGDGTFVIKQDGTYTQPIPLDELCVGSNTTSICSKDAIRHFYHAWGVVTPEAILIASDGLDESFSSLEHFYEFYDMVIRNSMEDWDENTAELEVYLPQLSEKGSRDDVSLAWIVDAEDLVS